MRQRIGTSVNAALRVRLAVDMERDRWATLEEWVRQHQGARVNPYKLSRETGVPRYLAKRFCISLRHRTEWMKSLEETVVALACRAENQQQYKEDSGNPLHWFSISKILDGAGLPYSEAQIRRVTDVLERHSGTIFNKVAEAVFSLAYSADALAAWSQTYAPKYFAAVAGAANTRPEIAQYVLEKHFGMPSTKIILDLSKKYEKENLKPDIAAQTLRAILSGNFRNGDINLVGLAKHLHERGVGQPMEVAAGLVKVWQESKK